MNFVDTPSITFSQGSADGPLPWILPDGREVDPLSLGAALASLSARQVKAMGLQISGISGRRGSTSSDSASLTSSLASRLQAQFGTAGSILFRQTWRQKATPLGQVYWEHTASGHRTSGSGFTGWPTPAARDHFPAHSAEYIAEKKQQGHGMSNLNDIAAAWATPATRDHKDTGDLSKSATRKDGKTRDDTVPRQAFGLANGEQAQTEKRASLNPALSRWLQGFPVEWCMAAIASARITQTVRQKRGRQG